MGPQYTYLLCSLTSTTSEYSLTYERSDSSGTFIATLKTLVCIQSILDYCGGTFSLVLWLIHWGMVGLGGCGLAHSIHGHTIHLWHLGVAKGKPIIALSKPFLGHRGISHCSLTGNITFMQQQGLGGLSEKPVDDASCCYECARNGCMHLLCRQYISVIKHRMGQQRTGSCRTLLLFPFQALEFTTCH